MILYPNAKINIGLNVINKRPDGFHDISSVFYPVNLTDILEFLPAKDNTFCFTQSGITIDGNSNDNLCVKVYRFFCEEYQIPAIKIHLHKNIPTQAGLGGGSSDAAFFIKGLNQYFNIGLTISQMQEIALTFGSDCPFFIENIPAIATGRGEILSPLLLNLSLYHIIIIKSGVAISTAEAYFATTPKPEDFDFHTLKNFPVREWNKLVKNDFEQFAFKRFPELKKIKETLLCKGALFTQMTGSGSAIYSIFDKKTKIPASTFSHAKVFDTTSIISNGDII